MVPLVVILKIAGLFLMRLLELESVLESRTQCAPGSKVHQMGVKATCCMQASLLAQAVDFRLFGMGNYVEGSSFHKLRCAGCAVEAAC